MNGPTQIIDATVPPVDEFEELVVRGELSRTQRGLWLAGRIVFWFAVAYFVVAVPATLAGVGADTIDGIGLGLMVISIPMVVWGASSFSHTNRGPWLLIAGAIAFQAAAWTVRGALIANGYEEVALYPPSTSSPTGWLLAPDLLSAASYTLIAAAMVWFGRLRSPRSTLASTLDVTIVVAAMSVVAWLVAVEPVLRSNAAIHLEIQSVLYTTFDMVLVFVGARHLFGTTVRHRPERYLLYGIGALIIGDLALQIAYSSYVSDWPFSFQPPTAAFPVAPAMAAAAATHPGMRIVATRRPALSRSSVQIAAIATGMLTPPVVLALGIDQPIHRFLVAGGCAALAGLLVWRYWATLNGLWRAENRAARAEAQERRRIAQQLHDGAIQDLLAVRFQIAAAGPDVSHLRDGIDTTLSSVRSAVAALRDSLDGTDTFAEVIAVDLERLEGLGHHVEFTQRVTEDVSPMSVSLAYRNTREALRNVARHAEASTVKVDVRCTDGWLAVSVTDDGRGFDRTEAAERARAGHIGVVSMAETVTEVGGEFAIISPLSANGGTTVTFQIPAQLSSSPIGTDHHLDVPAAHSVSSGR